MTRENGDTQESCEWRRWVLPVLVVWVELTHRNPCHRQFAALTLGRKNSLSLFGWTLGITSKVIPQWKWNRSLCTFDLLEHLPLRSRVFFMQMENAMFVIKTVVCMQKGSVCYWKCNLRLSQEHVKNTLFIHFIIYHPDIKNWWSPNIFAHLLIFLGMQKFCFL